MCMIDDAEPWDVSHSQDRKARKEHRCCECRRTITRGETYRRLTALYEKKWETYATCAHCRVAGSWLGEICGGYLSEGLLEDLEEHWSEEPDLRHHWLGLTILNMRRKWRDSKGNLLPVPTLKLPPKYLAIKAAAA